MAVTKLLALKLAIRVASAWGEQINADPTQLADWAASVGLPAEVVSGVDLIPDHVASHVVASLRDGGDCTCPPCIVYRFALGVRGGA